MDHDKALVKSIMEICHDCDLLKYYRSLHNHHRKDNMDEREWKIHNSGSSALSYYSTLNLKEKNVIYSSFMNDIKRSIITRWRLSNHRLQIEIGRYQRPFVQRENRVCLTCNVLEDERHAIFVCPRFTRIRLKYEDILSKNSDVVTFLNPSMNDKENVAKFLSEIEDIIN